jgi:demethylmenaquinone methyltransferase/2-methoxy-6-polyprenyl-1,4-benzoquinol methylase
MTDATSNYLRQIIISADLRKPALLSAIQTLDLPADSRGLDVGCGAGLQCLLLSEAVGPAGHVTGVDPEVAFLEHGRQLIEDAGLSKQVALCEGSAEQLPFEDNSFDWAWSVDCVVYGPRDPMPPLSEMMRVVRPGGTVAILAWSSEKLLPGYPVLEARLQATTPGLAPFARGMPPKRHLPRALGILREAGLVNLSAHAAAGSACAPLGRDQYQALLSLFEMRWPGAEDELEPEDLAEFERLCRPGSSDFILDHPDYYALFTYSMFIGKNP